MKFRPALFWDTDPEKIDPEKNARYLATQDWLKTSNYYLRRDQNSSREVTLIAREVMRLNVCGLI